MSIWDQGFFGKPLAEDEEWVPGSKNNMFTGRARRRKVGGVAEAVISKDPIKDSDETYGYLKPPPTVNWWDKPAAPQPVAPPQVPVQRAFAKDGQRPKNPPTPTPPQIEDNVDYKGFFEQFKKYFGNRGKPQPQEEEEETPEMFGPSPDLVPSRQRTPVYSRTKQPVQQYDPRSRKRSIAQRNMAQQMYYGDDNNEDEEE